MLIVDDIQSNRDLVKLIFDDHFNISLASNGQEALDIVKKEKIDIIILDLLMPVMDGFEFLAKKKEIDELLFTPVIVVTGLDDTESEIRALESGASDVIAKPFNSKVIIKRVLNIMNSIELERSKAEYKIYIEKKMLNSQLDLIFESIDYGVGMFNVEDDNGYNDIYLNSSYYKFLGYTKEEYFERNKNRDFFEDILEEEREYLNTAIISTLSSNVCSEINSKFQHQSGKILDARVKIVPAKNIFKYCDFLLVIVDSTLLNETKAKLNAASNQLDAFVKNINSGIATIEIGDEFELIYSNAALYEMLGYEENSITFKQLLGKDNYSLLSQETKALRKSARDMSFDFIVPRKDGSTASISLKGRFVGVSSKNNPLLFVVVIDNTKDKENTERLRYLALYDQSTGVYNASTFFDETTQMINSNKGEPYAFIRIDIYQFKVFKELFGNEQSNNLLINLASSLAMNVENGKYGRIEGDIFAVCIPASSIDIQEFIKRITDCTQEKYDYFKINLYFGIYIIKDLSVDISLICDRAAYAVESIKGSALRNFAYYDDEIRKKQLKVTEITNDMTDALANNEFIIYMQPVYDLETGNIKSAEALVRWKHPEKGLISPGIFIPIFEDNGFIVDLDYYVWEKVCKQVREWIDSGKTVIPVSVNVSRVNLYSPNFVQKIYNLVKKYDLPINLFRLEITESAYTINEEMLAELVKTLHSLGFIVLMDDFGSGYSSLNMLKNVPVDILKIDMKFLKDFEYSKKSASIIESIVRMANSLEIEVIAEGVETAAQLTYLRNIGSNMAQGFYFSKPVPVPELEDLIHIKKCVEIEDYQFNDFDVVFKSSNKLDAIFGGSVGTIGIVKVKDNLVRILKVNDSFFTLFKVDHCDNPDGLAVFANQKSKELFMEGLQKIKTSNEVVSAVLDLINPQHEEFRVLAKLRMYGVHDNADLVYFSITLI